MATKGKNTASIVRDLLEDKINSLGYDVWDVEYYKEGSDYHLVITIDSEKGIDIDDCEKVHRFIDPIIDEADPIESYYILQVSSPGVERNIRTNEHYKKCIGEMVCLKFFTPVNGYKSVIGKLLSFDDESENISVELENGEKFTTSLSTVSRANIYFNFD